MTRLYGQAKIPFVLSEVEGRFPTGTAASFHFGQDERAIGNAAV